MAAVPLYSIVLSRSLFPKEHGAYGQMAFPLVTSLAVAGVTTPALSFAVSVIAGFLAHEPLLVLLGHRGVRARREEGRRAIVWLAVSIAMTVVPGLLAIASVAPRARWSFLLPLVPLAVLAALIAKKQEKSASAEVAVALAFSAAAVPLCLAAEASTRTALAVAVAFASIFVTETLAVRVVVVRVRGGGNPRTERATRIAVLVLAAAVVAGVATAATYANLPWAAGAAAAPGLACAVWLALFPPAPSRLRTVGWTLVASSAAAALILVFTL